MGAIEWEDIFLSGTLRKQSEGSIQLLCVCVCVCVSCSVVSDSLRPHGLCPPDSSVHGILRQEYWIGVPFPPPGDLPDPGIQPGSPELYAGSLPSEPLGSSGQRLWAFFHPDL